MPDEFDDSDRSPIPFFAAVLPAFQRTFGGRLKFQRLGMDFERVWHRSKITFSVTWPFICGQPLDNESREKGRWTGGGCSIIQCIFSLPGSFISHIISPANVNYANFHCLFFLGKHPTFPGY